MIEEEIAYPTVSPEVIQQNICLSGLFHSRWEKSKNMGQNPKMSQNVILITKGGYFKDRRGDSIIPTYLQKLFNKTFVLANFFSLCGKNPQLCLKFPKIPQNPKNRKMSQNMVLFLKVVLIRG